MRIVVIVNHCAPNQGSEHGVGWGFVNHLSEYHDLTVVTRTHEYADELLAFEQSEEGRRRNIRFLFLDQHVSYRGVARWFPLAYYIDYNRWQRKVFDVVKGLIENEQIDLIHSITNITFREPGYLWKLGVPFVWGPVVILGNTPICFPLLYAPVELMKILLRRISCILYLRLSRRFNNAIRLSSACIAVSSNEFNIFRQRGARRTIILPETGAEDRRLGVSHPTVRGNGEPIEILWLSRFDSSKGVMLLLRALTLLDPTVHYRLTLVGDGDQRSAALRFADRNFLNVRWMGFVPYTEVFEFYSSSHLFVLTSMMDATTTVLFEALQAGLPVICPNHLSFAEVIDESCGIKLPMKSLKIVERALADAITLCYRNEPFRRSMSVGALAKAKEHSWGTKIQTLNQLYRDILEEQ